MEQVILASKKDNQGTPVPLLVLEYELTGDNTTGVGVLGKLKSSDGTLGGYTIVEWDTSGSGTPQITIADLEGTAGATPTGTGYVHVTDGVQDGAAGNPLEVVVESGDAQLTVSTQVNGSGNAESSLAASTETGAADILATATVNTLGNASTNRTAHSVTEGNATANTTATAATGGATADTTATVSTLGNASANRSAVSTTEGFANADTLASVAIGEASAGTTALADTGSADASVMATVSTLGDAATSRTAESTVEGNASANTTAMAVTGDADASTTVTTATGGANAEVFANSTVLGPASATAVAVAVEGAADTSRVSETGIGDAVSSTTVTVTTGNAYADTAVSTVTGGATANTTVGSSGEGNATANTTATAATGDAAANRIATTTTGSADAVVAAIVTTGDANVNRSAETATGDAYAETNASVATLGNAVATTASSSAIQGNATTNTTATAAIGNATANTTATAVTGDATASRLVTTVTGAATCSSEAAVSATGNSECNQSATTGTGDASCTIVASTVIGTATSRIHVEAGEDGAHQAGVTAVANDATGATLEVNTGDDIGTTGQVLGNVDGKTVWQNSSSLSTEVILTQAEFLALSSTPKTIIPGSGEPLSLPERARIYLKLNGVQGIVFTDPAGRLNLYYNGNWYVVALFEDMNGVQTENYIASIPLSPSAPLSYLRGDMNIALNNIGSIELWGTIIASSIGSDAGTGYAPGDELSYEEGGDPYIIVDTVDETSGAVLTYHYVDPDQMGLIIENHPMATITGTGSGLLISVTDINAQSGPIVTSEIGSNGGTGYAVSDNFYGPGGSTFVVDTIDGSPPPAINMSVSIDPTITINTVNTGTKTFTFNYTDNTNVLFAVGGRFTIVGSTGNDGLYTVASRSWTTGVGTVVVEEAIPSAVADGTIVRNVFRIVPAATADYPVGTTVTVTGTVANDGTYIVSNTFQLGSQHIYIYTEEVIPSPSVTDSGTLTKAGVTYGVGEVLTYTMTSPGTTAQVASDKATFSTSGGGDNELTINIIDIDFVPLTLAVKVFYNEMETGVDLPL